MKAGSAVAGFEVSGLATVTKLGGTDAAPEDAAGVSAATGPANFVPEAVDSTGGGFFETLTSSDFYKNTTVLCFGIFTNTLSDTYV